MQIQVPVANMYDKADENSAVVSQAIYGQLVNVLNQQDHFCHIQTLDGYQGWIAASHLYLVKKQKGGLRLKVRTVHNLSHVYSSPHVTKQKPLISLPFSVELDVIQELPEEKGRWIEVELVNGSRGWIQRGNVTFTSDNLNFPQMLQLSHQFVGLPYTWGGTSSFGFDCSGFVQMLFKEMGIFLPRDAHQQVASPLCCVVEQDLLSPGDLIFYGSSPDKIKHVSVFLGDDRIIQASVLPIPIVQVSAVDEPSLKERYAYSTVRRMF